MVRCSTKSSNIIWFHQGTKNWSTWVAVRKVIIIMGIKESKKYVNDEVDGQPSLTVGCRPSRIFDIPEIEAYTLYNSMH